MIGRFARDLLLTAIAVLFLSANCITAAAAEHYTIPITVKYGQTEARSMLDMINKFRKSSDAWYWNSDNKTKTQLTGLKDLQYDYGLEQIAMQRAAEIAVNWDHTRPDGTSCFTATASNGATSYGENIAAGYMTASSVFVGWREDDEPYMYQGHRRNMLGSSFTHIGIAHVVANGTHYWVQEFGYSTGVAKTNANDSNKTVNITLRSDMITKLTVTASATSMTVPLGKTADAPTATVKFRTEDTWIQWGGTEPTSTLTPTWTVSGSAVSLNGGKLTAKSIGNATLTATVCGKKLTVNVKVECTDHKWGGWSITKAATCTDQGSQTRKCTLCGKSETKAIAAKGHSFGAYKVTKAATCTDTGTETRTCSACNKTESRSVAAKGHSFGSYKVTKAATCTDTGTETRTCSACNKTESRSIEAKGHSFGAYKVTKAATCTDTGTETRTCSACDKTESRSVEAKGHKWGEYKVVSAATADAEGIEERTCSECKAVETRAIAKLPAGQTTTTTSKPEEDVPPTETSAPDEGTSSEGEVTDSSDSQPDEQTPDTSEADAPADSSLPDESSEPEASETESNAPEASDDASGEQPTEEATASDLASEAEPSEQEPPSAADTQTDESDAPPLLYMILTGSGAVVVLGLIIFFAARRKNND